MSVAAGCRRAAMWVEWRSSMAMPAFTCRTLLVAFSLFACSVAEAQTSRDFKQWWVACSNVRACVAFGLPGDSGTMSAFLRISRGGGTDAPVEILLGVPGWDTKAGDSVDAELEAVGTDPLVRLPVKLRVSKDEVYLSQLPLESTVGLLRKAERLRVTSKGFEPAEVSLQGAMASLLWMDEQQRRVGTPTALVARKGAEKVPAAPVPPSVRRARTPSQSGKPSTFPPAMKRNQEILECIEEVAPPEEAERVEREWLFTARLDAQNVLWGVPCGRGAYQMAHRLYLGDAKGQALRRAPLEAGVEPQDGEVMNSEFSPERMTLEAFAKGRGLGDCGTEHRWVWDGKRFRLLHEATMPHCRGVPSGLWAVTYEARLEK